MKRISCETRLRLLENLPYICLRDALEGFETSWREIVVGLANFEGLSFQLKTLNLALSSERPVRQ